MKEVFKPPFNIDSLPESIQNIILSEQENKFKYPWVLTGIVRDLDEDPETWTVDWWQLIFQRGGAALVYDVWLHGSGKPDVSRVLLDGYFLIMIQEVA
jgi:hypothetical protein